MRKIITLGATLALALTLLTGAQPANAAPVAGCAGEAIATLDDGTTERVCPVVVTPRQGFTLAYHDCFGNKICFWVNTGYGGALYMYPNYSDGRDLRFITGDNTFSSVRSRLTAPSNHVAMHKSPQCIDINPLDINPDQSYSNLHDIGYGDSLSCVDYGG